MSESSEPSAADVHQRLAKDLFNRVWDLLEKENRTREEDETMLNAAHASRFHWGEVGQPVNLARGDWQISRVNAVLGRVDAAAHHARSSLEILQENGIGDWDLAFAYEALARAAALSGDSTEFDQWMAKAHEAAADIADEEDRALVVADLADMPAVSPPA
jgi:hypothetical protein